MAQGWIEAILSARFLVAGMGETTSPPWWRCEATGPASLRMLERIYPRTFLAASLETASRAAGSEHDAHIRRMGTYHLFRLPIGSETALHELAASEQGIGWLRQIASLEGREAHLAQLAQLDALADMRELMAGRGPVRCGTVNELPSGYAVRRMCAAYARGFRDGTPVYPYLEAEAQR